MCKVLNTVVFPKTVLPDNKCNKNVNIFIYLYSMRIIVSTYIIYDQIKGVFVCGWLVGFYVAITFYMSTSEFLIYT